MRILALFIAIISGVLMINSWNTPEAIAWCVALCGWLPHSFSGSKEVAHGDQA